MAVPGDLERLRSRSGEAHGLVLLDNCDCLVRGTSLAFSDLGLSSGARVVFAGSRRWKEFVDKGRIPSTLKLIPLAVFLEKEAKQIISPRLSAEQQVRALSLGGTHPYLLKIVLSQLMNETPDHNLEQIVQDMKMTLSPFFQRCVTLLQIPLEHQVLTHLIKKGQPVNPGDVAASVGISNIKGIANTLCYLGLVSRWIREEEATLFANSRLFNEWYVETRASSL